MVQLVCPCLNIRIHGKGSVVQLRDSCDLKLSERALADDFFSSQVYDVVLDLGGVTKAQKNLCTGRSVDGWVITSCIGCEQEIYAKHLDDDDHVLVSCSIEDPSRITTLMESENYSSLFKLLLPEINDNFVQNNLGVSYSSNDSFERALKQLQQQVSSFLKEEQKAMEERIRVYTEQQQLRYSTLQQKIKKHKQAMLFLLLKRKELKKSSHANEQLSESLSPLSMPHHSSEDSSSSSDSAHVQDKARDFFMEGLEQVTPQAPVPRRPFRRVHSVNNPPQRTKIARPLKHVGHTIDIGDVFDMEGFETGDMDVPFFNSDDDTDESSTEDNSHSKREEEENKHYAGSVPISVPAWSHYSRYSIHDDDNSEVIVHKDDEQLAASFRALAQGSSVNDGTEIFGDLPRRRLNTGELVRSRPM